MPTLPTQLNEFKSLQTPVIFPMEFQVIDVERTLTPILERAVRSGRLSKSKTDKNSDAYDVYLDQLNKADKIAGLEHDAGRRLAVINGWIRSSVVVFNRKGDKKNREGMDYIRPLTLGIYRSGLPVNQATSRKIDQWVYRTALDELQKRAVDSPTKALSKLFIDALGKGISFGIPISDNPKYEGAQEIDINAMLAMSFLQGFPEPISRGKGPDAVVDPGTIRNIDEILFEPEAFRPIGQDVVNLLQLYGETLSAIEVTDHLAALVAIRLFQAQLRVARVLRATIEKQSVEVVGRLRSTNPVEIYSDFTNGKDPHSEDLAKRCVQRDLNYCQFLYQDRFLVQALLWAVPLLTDRGVDFSAMSMFERVKYLINTRQEQDFQMAMRLIVERFRGAVANEDNSSKEEWRAILEDLEIVQKLNPEEVLSNLMQQAQRSNSGLGQQHMWFYSTGGMRTSNMHRGFAILAGTQGAKSTWKYAMTDSVLTSIILLCFVEGNGSRTSKTLRLEVLLQRMKDRFGILVAEPPSNMQSYESFQAASSNKRAFISKLQLLGCYEGLSDDFSSQRVRRPREASK
jgi:hypothetical protein